MRYSKSSYFSRVSFLSISSFLMLLGVHGPPQRDGKALMEKTSFEIEVEIFRLNPIFMGTKFMSPLRS